jgi:hypothetical protein
VYVCERERETETEKELTRDHSCVLLENPALSIHFIVRALALLGPSLLALAVALGYRCTWEVGVTSPKAIVHFRPTLRWNTAQMTILVTAVDMVTVFTMVFLMSGILSHLALRDMCL